MTKKEQVLYDYFVRSKWFRLIRTILYPILIIIAIAAIVVAYAHMRSLSYAQLYAEFTEEMSTLTVAVYLFLTIIFTLLITFEITSAYRDYRDAPAQYKSHLHLASLTEQQLQDSVANLKQQHEEQEETIKNLSASIQAMRSEISARCYPTEIKIREKLIQAIKNEAYAENLRARRNS